MTTGLACAALAMVLLLSVETAATLMLTMALFGCARDDRTAHCSRIATQ